MSTLAKRVWRACSALGLRAEFGYRPVLPSGGTVVAVAWIKDLGAPKGMLLFSDTNEFRNYAQELISVGYGCSVVGEPRLYEDFDLSEFEEMFRDWGWSGVLGMKPVWMR
jgi:hypothetical protein